jgi:hypothetical protein
MVKFSMGGKLVALQQGGQCDYMRLMKDRTDIAGKAADLQKQLRAKLGVKSGSLEQGLHKAGRRLPRRVRARGQVIVDAQKLAGHPKLARQVNAVEIRDAYNGVSAHLGKIDVADRRKGKLLGLAGTIAGNLLIVVVGFLVWLWWRGYV